MVVRPSHLYHGNHSNWKDGLDVETKYMYSPFDWINGIIWCGSRVSAWHACSTFVTFLSLLLSLRRPLIRLSKFNFDGRLAFVSFAASVFPQSFSFFPPLSGFKSLALFVFLLPSWWSVMISGWLTESGDFSFTSFPASLLLPLSMFSKFFWTTVDFVSAIFISFLWQITISTKSSSIHGYKAQFNQLKTLIDGRAWYLKQNWYRVYVRSIQSNKHQLKCQFVIRILLLFMLQRFNSHVQNLKATNFSISRPEQKYLFMAGRYLKHVLSNNLNLNQNCIEDVEY